MTLGWFLTAARETLSKGTLSTEMSLLFTKNTGCLLHSATITCGLRVLRRLVASFRRSFLLYLLFWFFERPIISITWPSALTFDSRVFLVSLPEGRVIENTLGVSTSIRIQVLKE